MLPAQDDLETAHSLVNHTYSKENRTSSQYSLASDTSVKELMPSEDGNSINVEHQITGTRTGIEEYSEMDATDTRLNYYFIFFSERDPLALLTFARFFLAFLSICKQSCLSKGFSVNVV